MSKTTLIPLALELPVEGSGDRFSKEAFAKTFVEMALVYALANFGDESFEDPFEARLSHDHCRPLQDFPYSLPAGMEAKASVVEKDEDGHPILRGGDYVLLEDSDPLWVGCGAVAVQITHHGADRREVAATLCVNGHEDLDDLGSISATQEEAQAAFDAHEEELRHA